jgi:hypothetical protein
MSHLTLNAEQTLQLARASFPIAVFDAQGKKIGDLAAVASPAIDVQNMTDEEWTAECLRRKEQAERDGGEYYTTQEVLAHLASLENR